jgi:hypothetical protein
MDDAIAVLPVFGALPEAKKARTMTASDRLAWSPVDLAAIEVYQDPGAPLTRTADAGSVVDALYWTVRGLDGWPAVVVDTAAVAAHARGVEGSPSPGRWRCDRWFESQKSYYAN